MKNKALITLILTFIFATFITTQVFAMEIFVRTATGKNIILEVQPDETIDSVRVKIQEKEGYPTYLQVLTFNKQILQDGKTLVDYSIQKDSSIFLHIHSFDTPFTYDDFSHWRACEDENCAITTDSAPHIWDDGAITLAPTLTQNGSKTFTCLTCGTTRIDPVAKLVEPSPQTGDNQNLTPVWIVMGVSVLALAGLMIKKAIDKKR